ncbi:M16 family metallopeptidase [Bradymonas sediminis]|uniref:Uncharacterized protein n=1 Tax=Bradymonas sediminis TaxID=1548548 RepID=A0A2Z4FK40_9DELT|nr:pitrilysin family protein [Bradymonas sediminis]AWV89313.1 hypothetical protein DN745_08165 [Bradymonas sediminis]TDP73487.1 zinc protease [Bradymonas sediminis]
MNKMNRFNAMMPAVGILGISAALLAGSACSSAPAKPDSEASAGQLEGVEKLGQVDNTTAYKVGELTLIHKATPANAVVAARVYFSGGAAHLTETTAGIERLALNTAVSGGSESHPKDEFNAAVDSMGSSISTFSDRDYSGYAMQSTVEHFAPTWELMLESILEPQLPEAELNLQRQRHLADIKSLKENPDRLVGYIASELLFSDHPYATFQLGTVENVERFTRDELVNYQKSLLDPAEMTVVVVGNVPTAELIEKIRPLSEVKPSVELLEQELHPFKQSTGEVEVSEKTIPTNYIFGLYPAPAPGDADYEAMLVATKYLSDRLFEEVRTKRNLTYAVSAGLSSRRVNYGVLYVTAVDPSMTMPVIFGEIQKLKDGEFSPKDLDESRNVFITRHYMSLETNGSQATLLAESHIVAGDWTRFATSIDRLNAVTPEDVQRVAEKYMKDYRFGIVGSEEAIDKALFLNASAPQAPEVEGAAPEDGP